VLSKVHIEEDVEMKKIILSGIVGIAVLILSTAASAASCNSATVNAVGSGDANGPSTSTAYTIRWVEVTCHDHGGSSTRYYFHDATDSDGKMKASLTALSAGKTVSYTLYTGAPTDTYIVEFSVNGK